MSYKENVESMVFSDPESQKLITIRDEIVAWLKANIVPHVPKGHFWHVGFGDKYYPRGYSEMAFEYEICVSGDVEHFVQTTHTDYANVSLGLPPHDWPKSFEHTTDGHDIFPVVDNWSTIKAGFLKKIKDREYVGQKINDFKL